MTLVLLAKAEHALLKEAYDRLPDKKGVTFEIFAAAKTVGKVRVVVEGGTWLVRIRDALCLSEVVVQRVVGSCVQLCSVGSYTGDWYSITDVLFMDKVKDE